VDARPAPLAAGGRGLTLARGVAQLGIDGIVGVTDVVESMHGTILRGILGRPRPGRTRGLTGAIYGAVRGTTRVVGTGVDAVLRALPQAAEAPAPASTREPFVAALNGVWGDHLAATRNPLAIEMSLRVDGRPVDPDAPAVAGGVTPRVLVLVHGLCMSDRQWQRRGHDHGVALARDTGFTALYLHYNTGLHVAENGRRFAALLERVLRHWPVPVEEIAILGHSMGGLVARSACRHAARARHRWFASLTRLAFLGTPHHGALLERAGHGVDRLLGISPYAAPLAVLGKARSPGITDLRYGNVRDEDGLARDRHAQSSDDRRPAPLPRGVRTCVIAASTKPQRGRLHAAVVGDGIVPLRSALGLHADPSLALRVPAADRLVVAPANHLDLLDHPAVYARLREWLAEPVQTPRRAARRARVR
jgi:hypothetical protein